MPSLHIAQADCNERVEGPVFLNATTGLDYFFCEQIFTSSFGRTYRVGIALPFRFKDGI